MTRPEKRATAADPLEPIAPIVERVMAPILAAQDADAPRRVGSCAEDGCPERAARLDIFCPGHRAMHDAEAGLYGEVVS